MKNRSRVDIMAAMLRAAEEGVGKSRMMNAAEVSHIQLGDYLETMLGRGLLLREEARYTTTAKGRAFLRAYEVMEEVMRVR